MRIIKRTSDFQERNKGSVITIGVFDGIHLGHQRIIEECVRTARFFSVPSVLLTFSRNPREITCGESPCVITDYKKKMAITESMGVDYVISIDFDPSFASMEAKQFVSEILCEHLSARCVCVGENFHFGHGGMGDVDLLTKLGKEGGFQVKVIPLLFIGGHQVSSTLIRRLISEGEMDMVSRCLGRPYSVCGKVIYGHGRGKSLGFPTANLELADDYCLPPDGVYAGKVSIGGGLEDNETSSEKKVCAINIGDNPTFGDAKLEIEVYIVDFSRDLYGQFLELEFIHRLRNEVRFGSREELIEQMRMDVSQIEKLLLKENQEAGLCDGQ
ncbi:MAG: bifunctional riboflavin kinase/FAD synthetase [Actinomycetota bacterium]|nr:bifunctional riboflavin kinase/FAD synthetase [Actinomycetota bacterium]